MPNAAPATAKNPSVIIEYESGPVTGLIILQQDICLMISICPKWLSDTPRTQTLGQKANLYDHWLPPRGMKLDPKHRRHRLERTGSVTPDLSAGLY